MTKNEAIEVIRLAGIINASASNRVNACAIYDHMHEVLGLDPSTNATLYKSVANDALGIAESDHGACVWRAFRGWCDAHGIAVPTRTSRNANENNANESNASEGASTSNGCDTSDLDAQIARLQAQREQRIREYNECGYILEASRGFNYTFGIEFEVIAPCSADTLAERMSNAGFACHYEGYNHNDHADAWKIVTDSSLRGDALHRHAFEVVSPILTGYEGMSSVKRLLDLFAQANVTVNATCGTHVHIGAVGMSVEQMANIGVNYGLNEAAFDSIVSASRRGNAQWGQSIADHVGAFAFAQSVEELQRANHNDRYHKVNYQSFRTHHTIEFRQHQGTVDFKKIGSWVCLIEALCDWSKDHMSRVRNSHIDTMPWLVGNEALMTYFVGRALELMGNAAREAA